MEVTVIISSHPKNPFVTRVLDHVKIFCYGIFHYFQAIKFSSLGFKYFPGEDINPYPANMENRVSS
jgi:hypothetical protein